MKVDFGQLRIATLSHGHPALATGGAEIAARTLHQSLSEIPGITTMHLACVPPSHPLAEQSPPGNDRFLPSARLKPLTLTRTDPGEHERLLNVLESFQPRIIHLHHILGFGADAIYALRQRFPTAVILLTLHEFIAICHNQGQMVRTDGSLCQRAAPSDCSGCFPEISAGQFALRDETLRAMLSLVDGFVAPSAFLAERYHAWGIPAARITVIENAVEAARPRPAPYGPPRGRRGRFAFFGQITPFKGIDVLLEAVASLTDVAWNGCTLDVHGSNLELQPEAFQVRIRELIERAGTRVTWHGAYQGAHLPALMAAADWVVVPSIWWENSPLVIQEAFRNRRPVIASAIGGMAEKVRDGGNGLTFAPGNAAQLAERLQQAVEPKLWNRLQAGIVPPLPASEIADRHIRLYRQLLKHKPALALA
jgi:glycosyltransferase involved in cell wall biosynthesis